MSLNARILVGLFVGTAAGLVAGGSGSAVGAWVGENIAGPAGRIWLRLLLVVVVPLVFSTLVLGVAGIGGLDRLGRLGVRTLMLFVSTTLLAAALGLLAAGALRPGSGIGPELRASLVDAFAEQSAPTVAAAGEGPGFGALVALIPANPLAAAARGDLIAFIAFTLLFAAALSRVPPDRARPFLDIMDAVARATMAMIGFAMWLAPAGVAGLAYAVTARLGVAIIAPIGAYVAMVLVGLAVYQFGVLGLLAAALGGRSPRVFYRAARVPMITAFSTASSAATLPTTIRAAEEELEIPREISGFVLPLGATLHMNGTAYFMAVTIVFLAQAFGVALDLPTQATIAGMTVLTAVSAAGIPSGALPMMVAVLVSVGVPGEAIGLILGVEPLLGMARTSTNVTGDLVAAAALSRAAPGDPPRRTDPSSG
ncbi:MAG: dicarboxylate/amino acid:cation symporter [Gemmatimonadota bacterium]|nr:dicarboxylate/amino acid:cation symporter [Gemmatimonadota bacterium]